MSGILFTSSRSITRNSLRLTTKLVERSNTKVPINSRAFNQKALRITAPSFTSKFSERVLLIWPQQLRCIQSSAALQASQVVNAPQFPDSVSEGDVKLDKKVGDHVREDEVVMEIETDKTSMPVPAPGSGVIEEIFVKDGQTIKANQPLFKINITGEAPPARSAAAPSPRPPAPPPPPPPSPAPPLPQSPAPPSAIPNPAPRKPPLASSRPPPKPAAPAAAPPKPVTAPPAAAPPKPAGQPIPAAPPKPAAPASSVPIAAIRHAQSIIDTATVKMPPADPTKEISGSRTEQRIKMNRMRLKIASRLKEAQNTNAMLTTFNEIDMSEIMKFRKEHLEAFTKKYGLKLGFMSAFCKASAFALQDQPVVNAVIDGNEIIYRDYVDISVAVATPKGLVVPVLRNVEAMNFAEIEIAIAKLGEKAKKGSITVEDMDGGTFTISNGGVFGSLLGTPIINPPQSSILGMHGIFDRPIAVKGQVVIRPMMYVALTYDHRLIDGREAVMFLRKVKAAVEDPRIILAGL